MEVCCESGAAVCRAEGQAGLARAVNKGVNPGKQRVKASRRDAGGWLHPRLRMRAEEKLPALPSERTPGEILVFLLETQACLSKEKELK